MDEFILLKNGERLNIDKIVKYFPNKVYNDYVIHIDLLHNTHQELWFDSEKERDDYIGRLDRFLKVNKI